MSSASVASTKDGGPAILLKRRYDTNNHYVHVWGVVTCSGNAPVPGEALHQFPSAAKAAEKVFDEMPRRNMVLWNSMICDLMEFEPNAKPTHTSLIHDGLGLNVASSTALADFHCKWGKISDTSQVFDDMPHKSIVSFSAMIHGFANNGLYSESLQRFLDMQRTCIHPNHGVEIAWIAYATGHGRISAFVLKHALMTPLNPSRGHRTSSVNNHKISNSVCLESVTDSQSDCGEKLFIGIERLAAFLEIKNRSSTSPSKVETDALQQQLTELRRQLDLVENSKQLAMLEVVNAEAIGDLRRDDIEEIPQSGKSNEAKQRPEVQPDCGKNDWVTSNDSQQSNGEIQGNTSKGSPPDSEDDEDNQQPTPLREIRRHIQSQITFVNTMSFLCLRYCTLNRNFNFKHFKSLEVLYLYGINLNGSMLHTPIRNCKALKSLDLVCCCNNQLIQFAVRFLQSYHFIGEVPSLDLLNIVIEVGNAKKILQRVLKEGKDYEYPNEGVVVRVKVVGKLEEGPLFLQNEHAGEELFQLIELPLDCVGCSGTAGKTIVVQAQDVAQLLGRIYNAGEPGFQPLSFPPSELPSYAISITLGLSLLTVAVLVAKHDIKYGEDPWLYKLYEFLEIGGTYQFNTQRQGDLQESCVIINTTTSEYEAKSHHHGNEDWPSLAVYLKNMITGANLAILLAADPLNRFLIKPNQVNKEVLLRFVELKVLIPWLGRLPEDTTLDFFESVFQQCPTFHLEDKVVLKGKRIDTTLGTKSIPAHA